MGKLGWFKRGYPSGGGRCAGRARTLDGGMAVRGSQYPFSSALAFPPAQRGAFLSAIRSA